MSRQLYAVGPTPSSAAFLGDVQRLDAAFQCALDWRWSFESKRGGNQRHRYAAANVFGTTTRVVMRMEKRRQAAALQMAV